MSRNLTEHDYELLSAYLDGEITDQERAELEGRLQADPVLRQELATLRQTVQLVNQLPILKSPRDLTLDVSTFTPRRTLSFPVIVSAAGAIAAIFLLTFGVYFLRLDTVHAPEAADVAQAPTMTDTLMPLSTPTAPTTMDIEPFAATMPDTTTAAEEQEGITAEEPQADEADDAAADGAGGELRYAAPADEFQVSPSPSPQPSQAPPEAMESSGAAAIQSQEIAPTASITASVLKTEEMPAPEEAPAQPNLDNTTVGTILVIGGGVILVMVVYFVLNRWRGRV
ncbi:MAG: hypothetical protein K8L99_23195 [Anaerolineae bacterium]|nr:hypothetical protein [Anaerolineae bacterium]